MRNRALVELTVRYGTYGEQQKTIAVPISEELMQELMGSVELSDEPLSLLMASPGLFGGKGGAVTFRRKTFAMRLDVAKQIAAAMVPELLRAFAVNDVLDGYRVDSMSKEERAWYLKTGRLT